MLYQAELPGKGAAPDADDARGMGALPPIEASKATPRARTGPALSAVAACAACAA